MFLQLVSKEIEEMKALHVRPHIAILLYVFGKNDIEGAGSNTHTAGICQALGPDSNTCQTMLEECKASLLELFPKHTAVGDSHSYVQFQKNPPGGRSGTVHVSQLCPFYEPPMGANWGCIDSVFPQRLQVFDWLQCVLALVAELQCVDCYNCR